MAETKRKELTINEARFLGRVVGDPQIVGTGENECAWVKLSTNVRELATNGQWIESTQVVPLLVTDHQKVNVIKQYVKDGRELSVKCYYKAWEHEGQTFHGMAVTQVELGRTLFKPKDNQASGFVPPMGG
jgi:single-stranded DNA-binding protein